MKKIKIGIIVADLCEYKPLADFIEKGNFEAYNFLGRTGHKFFINTKKGVAEVISLLCGIGKVNAATVAAHFVDMKCDIILNYGLSGGISGISRGEICICNRFLEHDFDLTGIGYKLSEKPQQEYIYTADNKLISLAKDIIKNVKCGTAVSGDKFVSDNSVKKQLKNDFDAMSCDMETAAIAYVCNFADIPFLAIRRISDDAGENANKNYQEMNNSEETLLSDYVIKLIKKILED